MTDERFNGLVKGPLSHPLVPFTITRLVLALRAVVTATGAAGEAALEAWCAARRAQDEQGNIDDFAELGAGGCLHED